MIFLHIGRTKTGTTALQAFLGSNADVLSKAELHFPTAGSRGNAHHDVALALTPKRMQRATEEARRIALNELAAMKQHVRSGRNLIVSSEMFQQADPKLVAAIFPPGDTRIIVYLREQYDYLVSAYAQRIQVSLARTPFVRYAARFNPDYLPFLESWATFFGRENIDVGIYDRSLLLNGDIRQDFLARLNISAADFKNMLSMPKNPSIGAQLIEFKGILNSLVPAQIHSRFDIGGQLSRVAGKSEKFSASAAFAVEYRARFKSNDIVEKHYLGVSYYTEKISFWYGRFGGSR